MKIKNILIIAFLSVFILGCSEIDPLEKADLLLGYWHVSQETTIYVNDVISSESEKEFYYEFYNNDCGQLYDQDEKPTNEIKWALQVGDSIDVLFISTALNSVDGSSDLYRNEFSVVEKIGESKIRTLRTNDEVIDGDEYSYTYKTFFKKQ